eukprot:9316469-Pyramimonas_sp.AAC.2
MEMTNWLESCPCHEHMFQGMSTRKKRRRIASLIKHEFSDCPMKGCRSSELAAGELYSKLSDWLSIALASFLDQMDPSLGEDGRRIVCAQFEFAKTYLDFTVTTKFSFWQKLPWSLCGLGHHWPSTRRRMAAAAIQEFDDSLGQVELRDHHMLTREFCQIGGPLRADMEILCSLSLSLTALCFTGGSLPGEWGPLEEPAKYTHGIPTSLATGPSGPGVGQRLSAWTMFPAALG